MTVIELISQAYVDAQLVAETGETVNADQFNTGLKLLNRVLRLLSTDGFKIPLITQEIHNFITGQNTLDLPGWSDLVMVQYLLGNVLVRIPLAALQDYYDNAVIENSSGVPVIAYKQRTPTGILLHVFLPPNDSYTVKVRGYKTLPTQDLNGEFDIDSIEGFMGDYIGYLLAADLQFEHQVDKISPYLLLKINQYESNFSRLKSKRIQVRQDVIPSNEDYSNNRSLTALSMGQGWRP